MSRKTNSISLRLGLLQVWSIISNCYGKNLKPYSFFWSKTNLKNYLARLFINNSLTLGCLHWAFKFNKVLIIITYINPSNLKVNSYKIYKNVLKVLKFWVELPVYIYIFEAEQLNLASFIALYFGFKLNNNKNIVLKNILKIIRLNTKRVILSSAGPVTLTFNGFKIRCSGRSNNTRNSMSKTFKFVSNSVTLSRITNYVDYTHKLIYTKLGTYSIHVWVSYSVVF
uniref:Ribosomal protein S3 n=2 Tax=Nemaliophycidae TaxID=2045258 RepID=A0A8T9EJI1_9FLOR|nr:ribosomal protein S3 [Thorea hispida]ARX95961.1 ribosomal protein S3 [Thorea hispida]UNJ79234.1 ribosomal protein S3 [Audouinella sp.]